MLALYIVAGLIFFVVLLLCIPVETTAALDTGSGKKFTLIVSWLFGIINKDIGNRKQKQIKKRTISVKKKRLPSMSDIDVASQIVNAGGLLKRLKDLIIGIYRQIKIAEITGDLVVGLEDPAHTGMLFAFIGPTNALLNLHPKYNVSIRPFFDDANILEGTLNGNVKFQPIRLVGPVLKIAASKEVRRIGQDYIKKKWRSKRKKA
ncbi:MAG: DUF2953 domain-containing protein [Dehalococcoidales bacterium]|nr:MAG: DUF2953 domain-containing protein [Dehalococcoidales bacterium]